MNFSTGKTQAIAFTLVTFLATTASADRKWDADNNPNSFDMGYVRNFYQLPMSGEMDTSTKRGWGDSYWPRVKGSIANRWQVRGSKYKEDKSPTYYQLGTMTESQIDLLSPAEKFDIARGRLNFPIASKIRKEFKTNEKDWRGLCNGWTHASLNFAEPNPIVYVDPSSGRRIPFGSSDIKGLLAHYYSHLDESGARYIGKSCRPGSRFLFNFNGACSDVHPASLHIVMTNELGIKHRGFAADRDPSTEVWNQPFVKFESRVYDVKIGKDMSKKTTEGTRKEVYVASTLYYVNELYDTEDPLQETADHAAPSYYPVLATQKLRKVEYRYVLELNIHDRIIGGEWISDEHPDLIWRQDFAMPTIVQDDDHKKDDWSLLGELVRLATETIPAALGTKPAETPANSVPSTEETPVSSPEMIPASTVQPADGTTISG